MDKDNLTDDGKRLLAVLDEASRLDQKMRLTVMAGSKPNSVHIMTMDQRQRIEARDFAVETARLAKIAELNAEAEFKSKHQPWQVSTPAPTTLSGAPMAPNGADLTRPQPKQRCKAQDETILQEIKKQGYNPLKLPKRQAGKPGVKAAIRAVVDGKGLFTGTTVFDASWERLRKFGDIVD